MKKLGEVKRDFARIKLEVAEIQKMQAEALNTVRSELTSMISSLQTLGDRCLTSEVCAGFISVDYCIKSN